MANDLIRYDLLVQEALRGVLRKVLADAARDGLPGEHFFHISFRTQASGVRLSNRMREQYPAEMTIVLQHQFWDLSVTEHAFEVGLSFNNIPERLLIPFEAVTGFFDQSVQFGLKFEVQEAEEGANDEDGAPGDKTGIQAEPPSKLPRAEASQPTSLPARRQKDLVEDGKKSAKPASKAMAKSNAEKLDGVKPDAAKGAAAAEKDGAGKSETDDKVVSIDAFRRKP